MVPDRRPQTRQDFTLNLSTRRRLCNTVGCLVEGGAADICAICDAHSRAAATTSLPRASLALVLRALFGTPKSSALVIFFNVLPPFRAKRTLMPTNNTHRWLNRGEWGIRGKNSYPEDARKPVRRLDPSVEVPVRWHYRRIAEMANCRK
jgi:hypothetical protein